MQERILIQAKAKAYSESNSIGSNEIRRYATLYQQDDDADRVVVVTTGDFTAQARELAEDLNVDAIDRRDLLGLIAQSEVEIGSAVTQTGTDRTHDQRENRESSDAEDHPMWIPLLLTGALVTALVVASGLYHGGVISEGTTVALIIVVLAAFFVVTIVVGRLYRAGRIDP